MNPTKWDVSEQGTSGWLVARNGCLTASKMDAAAKPHTPWPDPDSGKKITARQTLIIAICAERMTGRAKNNVVTGPMLWGLEHEQYAADRYEEETGVLIGKCGFALHGDIEYFGASPDRLVKDGLLEIKCPTEETHTRWKFQGVVPKQHKPQMLAQLAVTQRKWCDFVSYDPRFPVAQQFFLRRFEPTAEEIAEVEEAAKVFLAEVDEMFDQLTRSV